MESAAHDLFSLGGYANLQQKPRLPLQPPHATARKTYSGHVGRGLGCITPREPIIDFVTHLQAPLTSKL